MKKTFWFLHNKNTDFPRKSFETEFIKTSYATCSFPLTVNDSNMFFNLHCLDPYCLLTFIVFLDVLLFILHKL